MSFNMHFYKEIEGEGIDNYTTERNHGHCLNGLLDNMNGSGKNLRFASYSYVGTREWKFCVEIVFAIGSAKTS